jgi:hypothetical protein
MGVEVVLQFLTSRLGGSEWAASRLGSFTLRKGIPDADGAPEPVWALWSREKFLISAGDRTETVQPINIQTELSGTFTLSAISNICI